MTLARGVLRLTVASGLVLGFGRVWFVRCVLIELAVVRRREGQGLQPSTER